MLKGSLTVCYSFNKISIWNKTINNFHNEVLISYLKKKYNGDGILKWNKINTEKYYGS